MGEKGILGPGKWHKEVGRYKQLIHSSQVVTERRLVMGEVARSLDFNL